MTTHRGIGVLAARPDSEVTRSLKDLSFEVAKFAGFVRFNPDVNFLGEIDPGTLVPDAKWEYFDAHGASCLAALEQVVQESKSQACPKNAGRLRIPWTMCNTMIASSISM